MAMNVTLQDPTTTAFDIATKGYRSRLENQAMQDALVQSRQRRQDVADIIQNPEAGIEDYSNLMLKYPDLQQPIMQMDRMKQEETKKRALKRLGPIFNAVMTGSPEVAISQLKQDAQAAQAAGDERRYNAATTLLNQIETNPKQAANVIGIQLATVLGPDDFIDNFQKIREMSPDAYSGVIPPGSIIRSTKQFEDGTVQVITDKGPIVVNAAGERVTGQQAAESIQSAQDYETRLKQLRALGTEQAKQSIDQASEGFKTLQSQQSTIQNLDEAIKQIQAGANTGIISQYLPSFRAATRRLEQQGRVLGLDVIAGAKFGALSESEMNVAMSTAIDLGQEEDALVEDLQRRKEARKKLVSYLRDVIVFQGQGGTLAERVAINRLVEEKNLDQEQASKLWNEATKALQNEENIQDWLEQKQKTIKTKETQTQLSPRDEFLRIQKENPAEAQKIIERLGEERAASMGLIDRRRRRGPQ